ncbi:MAG: methylaspartate mutase accessory protein GlmL [Clostridia bacterium]
MKNVLLVDFGSTYTKVTAIDVETAQLLGTANAYTTVQTDVMEGLNQALAALMQQTGPLTFCHRFACSSAAGGLKMVVSGLVPSLTAEVAKMACLGAGAKVLHAYSYQLTEEDIDEITSLKPDILLLAGGTDGGNTECILSNAQMLSHLDGLFPIIIAGNRSVAQQCARILNKQTTFVCENVMPKFGQLNIIPVQQCVRDLFLQRIIQAKGLSKVQTYLSGNLMPTPVAMMKAMELLAGGCAGEFGIGELMAVDVGGATTDVYSIADGMPKCQNLIYKGLPEPYSKRTVEGDIGMRYSIHGIVEAVGADTISALSGIPLDRVVCMIDDLGLHTEKLVGHDPELNALEYALASSAVKIAVTRHVGTLEEAYTMMGLTYLQSGKDLRDVRQLIVTGGCLIHTEQTARIASHGLYDPHNPMSLSPKRAKILVDRKYLLAGLGLLSCEYPTVALRIMKKELEDNGYCE